MTNPAQKIGAVVARVRMSKLDAQAYEAAFNSIFSHVKKNHPGFRVGKSLKGIIADWSDTQISGLKSAIGEETANSVVKGCHYSETPPTCTNFYFFSRYTSNDQ